MSKDLNFQLNEHKLSIIFSGELTLYNLSKYQKKIYNYDFKEIKSIIIDLSDLLFLDTAAAIFIVKIEEKYNNKNINTLIKSQNETILSTLELVKMQRIITNLELETQKKKLAKVEKSICFLKEYFMGVVSFMNFFGKLVVAGLSFLSNVKNIRYKEIIFEVNESAVKAIGIVALTSFLIGIVVAYQSAYQLKLYGANIFIVDMLGISILRELAPLITAIVIAGRSGSAFTAQIGAMKITQELDAMKTMGFDPFAFLVMPRIIALMISMPILIFIADMMGILGGIIVSSIDLGITTDLFLDRFREVIEPKHFFIGIIKGPFFAFLIASIGIYRGLSVKDDTQSIGINTTKSVVESIFAVIVCDAVFSIALTNLGI